jgi:hypothetical protein
MGYLEIILLGYMINISVYAGILVLSILLTLGGMFIWGDKNRMMTEGLEMQKLSQLFHESKKVAPRNVYMDASDYSLFFPFMMVYNGLRFLWFSGKYGIIGYTMLYIHIKLEKIEEYLKDKIEEDKDMIQESISKLKELKEEAKDEDDNVTK